MDELRGRIMSKLTALRMLCDDPKLLKHSADIYNPMTGVGSGYAADLKDMGLLDKDIKSEKLDVLIEYLESFLSDNPANKAVIFTSYVECERNNNISRIAIEKHYLIMRIGEDFCIFFDVWGMIDPES